jgi:hypothetical protein
MPVHAMRRGALPYAGCSGGAATLPRTRALTAGAGRWGSAARVEAYKVVYIPCGRPGTLVASVFRAKSRRLRRSGKDSTRAVLMHSPGVHMVTGADRTR